MRQKSEALTKLAPASILLKTYSRDVTIDAL